MKIRDDEGASSVEYALIAVAIAAVVVVIVFALGLQTQGMFSGTCDGIAQEIDSTTC